MRNPEQQPLSVPDVEEAQLGMEIEEFEREFIRDEERLMQYREVAGERRAGHESLKKEGKASAGIEAYLTDLENQIVVAQNQIAQDSKKLEGMKEKRRNKAALNKKQEEEQ